MLLFYLTHMHNDAAFKIWAPDQSPWSAWAKPVLFSYLDAYPAEAALEIPQIADWCPSLESKTALVIDLPSVESVAFGLALAQSGYRPVPLYNAVPLPSGELIQDLSLRRALAVVEVTPIICALVKGIGVLDTLDLPEDAPPVFLLDANRHGSDSVPPDLFDNRSICFTTDFPTANFLLAHNIERMVLVQKYRAEPKSDLSHVFRRWQDGGLQLARVGIAEPTQPETFHVRRPAWFGAMFQRALAAVGLRRNSAGGFGAWMHDSASGG